MTTVIRRLGGRGVHPPEGSPSGRRTGEFEGYRALAAVFIVLFHVSQNLTTYSATGIPQSPLSGTIGSWLSRFDPTDLFFLLSAFLLAIPYARAAFGDGKVRSSREFLFRRAVRILPLYWVVVLVVWAIRNPALPGDWRDLVEHLTFTQVYDTKRIFYTVGPGWSLAIEVTFYLILVLLGPIAVRRAQSIADPRRRAWLLLSGCATLFAVPVIWRQFAWHVLHRPVTDWSVWFAPYARFEGFAAGMGLAVLVVACQGRRLFSGTAAVLIRVFALAVLVVAVGANVNGSPGWLVFHSVAALCWAAVLASTVLGPGGQRWSRALSSKVLVRIGLVSYSLYLWHEPIMIWLDHHVTSHRPELYPLTAAVVLAVSLVVAWLSYWCIEYPTQFLMKTRDREGLRRNYYPDLAAPDLAAGDRADHDLHAGPAELVDVLRR